MIGACAAIVATLGDLIMLSVTHGAGWLQVFGGAVSVILWIGAAAGLAIALYVHGYRQAADLLERRLDRTIVRICGIGIGLFGTLTHLLTALDIQNSMTSGAIVRPPEEAFAPGWSALFICAAAAGASALVASGAFVRAVLRAPGSRNGIPALFNPVLVTAALIVLASGLGAAGDYLGPAAPNMAHILFFFACSLALRKPRK